MPRLSLFFILIFGTLAIWQVSNASININTEAVEKTVVFLYAATDSGSVDKDKPLGTGFFVDVPLRSESKRGYRVLVTARHIVDHVWAHCGNSNPTVIYARLNKKAEETTSSGHSGIAFIQIPLQMQGKPTWEHHPDNDIDAAVLSIPENLDSYDIAGIPISLFPNEAEVAQQSIGDPVMSAGLLPAIPGVNRNYPIFKFGNISNIPREDIETRCNQLQPAFLVKVWLIAANLVPGNSGSPIFHVPLGGSGIVIGGTRPMILGIQSISFIGSDVAGMTPIKYVYEILEKIPFPDGDLSRGPLPLPSAK